MIASIRLLSLRPPALLGLALTWMITMTIADSQTQAADPPRSVLELQASDIDGSPLSLAQFKGDVLLIVNTASECGYTPQYEGLEAIYKTYKPKGFQILAFPCNDFGNQEPGANSEIKQFCKKNYAVSFPLFGKVTVKGDAKHPVYQFLTARETNSKFAGEIPWNFAKFLVDRKGQVIARFDPGDKPEGPKVTKAIEDALAQPK